MKAAVSQMLFSQAALIPTCLISIVALCTLAQKIPW